jgi:hypothetical protein
MPTVPTPGKSMIVDLFMTVLGFVAGRYIHVFISSSGFSANLFVTENGTYKYALTQADVINLAAAFIAWMYLRNKKYLGEISFGWLIYSLGFEAYELTKGKIIGQDV